MNRLQDKYQNEVVPAMMKEFNYKSVMEVPAIEKVVVNIGVGDAIQNSKLLDEAVEELAAITDSSQLLQKLRNQSLTSNFVKECQLDVKLLCVVRKCMSS